MAPRKKPVVTEITKEVPAVTTDVKELPEAGNPQKETPEVTTKLKKIPVKGVPENMIMLGGKMIEIKPTKLKYQRDRTAVFYRILELYPLIDILGMDDTSFGDGRDGDKALFDWLIAVTDDPDLITECYDEIDTDTVEKLMSIFRRVNKIDEKEAKLKNALAPGAKAKA